MTPTSGSPDSSLLLNKADFLSISEHPISTGGFGDVHVGEHIRFGRVAMKRLRMAVDRKDDAIRVRCVFSPFNHVELIPYFSVLNVRATFGVGWTTPMF